MKITKEHYEHLKSFITKEAIVNERASILNSGRQPKDFDVLLAWNCLYICVPIEFLCKELYAYLNDNHITTALKQIVKERLSNGRV